MAETNVFVKYLPSTVNDDQLLNLFSPFGEILSTKVMRTVGTGASLGYGFVRFKDASSATKAIKGMTGKTIGNKVLLCKLSNAFSFPAPSPNLYIYPLPLDLSEDQLKEIFGRFGSIKNAKLKRDGGTPDSFIGFILYDEIESAAQAIKKLNGTFCFDSKLPTTVKYAESDEQRYIRKSNTWRKPSTISLPNAPVSPPLLPPFLPSQTTPFCSPQVTAAQAELQPLARHPPTPTPPLSVLPHPPSPAFPVSLHHRSSSRMPSSPPFCHHPAQSAPYGEVMSSHGQFSKVVCQITQFAIVVCDCQIRYVQETHTIVCEL